MPNFDKLHKYASNFYKLAQMPQPEPLGYKQEEASDFPTIIFNAGLSPWAESPTERETQNPKIDYGSDVFTKYINPALDNAGTAGKVNITFGVDPNLNAIISVSGDPTSQSVQNALQNTWGKAMTQLFRSSKATPPSGTYHMGNIVNYG